VVPHCNDQCHCAIIASNIEYFLIEEQILAQNRQTRIVPSSFVPEVVVLLVVSEAVVLALLDEDDGVLGE
jgi:hypothetical protein